MTGNHIPLTELSYRKEVREWLDDRYGAQAEEIWQTVSDNYDRYLTEMEDMGGRKNGHAQAIYGGLLIFALYTALPDQPPVSELQDFVQNLFMAPFKRLGKVFDLNHEFDMRLIDTVFQIVGKRDRKDARKYPAGFINVSEPYNEEHHASRYHFTQCPNAEFARKHDLLHVLPLLCNCDFFGIEQIHGQLIRRGTCGNSTVCDYLVVGNRNPLVSEYETVTDEGGFLVSRIRRKKGEGNCAEAARSETITDPDGKAC